MAGLLVRRTLPLSAILATKAAMGEVIASGRLSETPDAPVWVKARQGMPGFWELADGHHRVAAALRGGRLTVEADCDPQPDDEPLVPPFHLFPTGSGVRAPYVVDGFELRVSLNATRNQASPHRVDGWCWGCGRQVVECATGERGVSKEGLMWRARDARRRHVCPATGEEGSYGR